MRNGLRAKGDAKGRLRGSYTFTLSAIANARIRFLAKQHNMTASAVVEMLVGGVDYQTMFALFEQRAPLGQIVVQTGQPPAVVRMLFEEYRRDLYEATARRAAPPVALLPASKK